MSFRSWLRIMVTALGNSLWIYLKFPIDPVMHVLVIGVFLVVATWIEKRNLKPQTKSRIESVLDFLLPQDVLLFTGTWAALIIYLALLGGNPGVVGIISTLLLAAVLAYWLNQGKSYVTAITRTWTQSFLRAIFFGICLSIIFSPYLFLNLSTLDYANGGLRHLQCLQNNTCNSYRNPLSDAVASFGYLLVPFFYVILMETNRRAKD